MTLLDREKCCYEGKMRRPEISHWVKKKREDWHADVKGMTEDRLVKIVMKSI